MSYVVLLSSLVWLRMLYVHGNLQQSILAFVAVPQKRQWYEEHVGTR
jgi:hypothetical protein